jgi:hypothetical protein
MRAAETWYRRRSVDCRQVHVTASRPWLSGLAGFLAQSHRPRCARFGNRRIARSRSPVAATARSSVCAARCSSTSGPMSAPTD